MDAESTSTGTIPFRVYSYFFKNMASPPVLLLMTFFFLGAYPFRAAGDEWFGEFAAGKSK